jgi:uncharacterized membrane protein (UPF0127 family)
MHLVNARTNKTIATDVEMATTRAERRRGLLGRDALDPSAALVISPCSSIHTVTMRFAIDVIFVDAEWRVLKVARNVRPWRIALCAGARVAIELAADHPGVRTLAQGDRLYLADKRATVAPRCDTGSSQNSTTSGCLSSVA